LDAASRLQRLTALAEYQGGSLVAPVMQYGLEHKKVTFWHGGKKISGYYLGTSRDSSPGQVGRGFLCDSRGVVQNSRRTRVSLEDSAEENTHPAADVHDLGKRREIVCANYPVRN
jgi:hypothetical protein